MLGQMIDHVSLQVADVAASRAFYEVVLAPVGLRPVDMDGAVGFTDGAHFPFWLSPARRDEDRELHIAFGPPAARSTPFIEPIGGEFIRPHDVSVSRDPATGSHSATVLRVVHLEFEVRGELRLDPD